MAVVPFSAFTTIFTTFAPTARFVFPVTDSTVAFSLTGVALTAILVTELSTVAVYFVVLPLKAGDNVPGEIVSAFKELSADKAAVFVLLPVLLLLPVPELLPFPAFPLLPELPLLPALLLFPVLLPAASFLTVTEVLLPAMESNSSAVLKITPSVAERDMDAFPAAIAFNVTLKLSLATEILPPPPP